MKVGADILGWGEVTEVLLLGPVSVVERAQTTEVVGEERPSAEKRGNSKLSK